MYTIRYIEHLVFTKKGNCLEAPVSNELFAKLGNSVTATIMGISKYGFRALTMIPEEKWNWMCKKYEEAKRNDPASAWQVKSLFLCSHTSDLSTGIITLPADFAEYAEISSKGVFFQENEKWFLCTED